MDNLDAKRVEQKRQDLKDKKPLAFAKILKLSDKIKNQESVALIQLQYNYACNFACKHCAIERFKQQAGRTLTVADVKSISDQADVMGLASICISGGEPLIFPDLEDVFNAIGPERFVLSIDTNGWLLTEDKVKWLVDKGLDRIHLSIDGLKSNHSIFRGVKGSWDKCVEALGFCKKHGLGVIINIVVTKSLIKSGELARQLDFVKQFGFHSSLIYAKATGSFEDSKDEICDSKDIEYAQFLTTQYDCSSHLNLNCGYEFGCMCFKRHLSIIAHGDVLPCPWIPISMGNIFTEPLQVIIQRGLNNKWFSYDHKYSCQSGNCDTEFYNKILPQIETSKEYPVKWTDIDWK